VRLQASSEGAPSVSLHWSGSRPLLGWRADVFGHRESELAGDGRSFELSMAPHELATLVLRPVDSAAQSDDIIGMTGDIPVRAL
jgi:hypothetical protein